MSATARSRGWSKPRSYKETFRALSLPAVGRSPLPISDYERTVSRRQPRPDRALKMEHAILQALPIRPSGSATSGGPHAPAARRPRPIPRPGGWTGSTRTTPIVGLLQRLGSALLMMLLCSCASDVNLFSLMRHPIRIYRYMAGRKVPFKVCRGDSFKIKVTCRPSLTVSPLLSGTPPPPAARSSQNYVTHSVLHINHPVGQSLPSKLTV